MKKFLSLLVLLSLITITSCSKQETQDTSPSTQAEEQQSVSTSDRILIAYFSWADNTIVEDEEGSIESALQHYESVGDRTSESDAVSSASILQPGNVSKMATWIQEEIGGDVFSIQVRAPYPSNYDECLDRAADEKAEDTRPALKEKVSNMEDYDTVFIGYPNWWYSVPMPILTFIEENDLSNKNIVLFCSHGTGGLARSVEDIQNALPDTVHLEENVIGIYRSDINHSKEDIIQWLNEIGYKKEA